MELRGGIVYTPFERLEQADICVRGKKITAVTQVGEKTKEKGAVVIDITGKLVIPGLIDIHMHGGFGWDVNSGPPKEETLIRLARLGTTSFLPTLYSTESREIIITAIRRYKKFLEKEYEGARILGIHMEGPFLNPKLGAQKPECCEVPKRDGFKVYLDEADKILLMMTLSPELDGSIKLIENLSRRGIVPAVGHSSAGKDELGDALKAGLRHGTHIFNATSRPDSKMKGAIKSGMDEFCLAHDEISVDIMVDSQGLHFDNILLQLAWKCKGPDKLFIISDSMWVVGLTPGRYDSSDGRKIIIDGSDVARLENGCLSGSSMTIIGALKNIIHRLNLPIEEALQTATVNPAKLLGIENSKGSIAPGMDADMVVVDKSLNVYMTIVEGKIMYKDKSIRGGKT